MTHLLADLRFTLRNLARRPAFAAVAILTLALGIGANAAIFSVLDAVLLEPLPYSEPERLVQVHSAFPGLGFEKFWVSPPEYLDLDRWAESYSALGAYVVTTENVASDPPQRATTAYVTATLWDALGVTPLHGRTFTPEEDRPDTEQVAVLGHGIWQRAFGSDPAIVGERVEVDGIPRTVVGVLPPEVDLDDAGVDVWLPARFDPADPGGRGSHFLYLIGRLAPGIGVEQAQAELDLLLTRWQEEYPDTHAPSAEGHPYYVKPLKEELVGDVRPAVMLLLGAVGLVLLVACVNVANLLLARAERRRREIAVRTALGAGRGRLLGQLLTESIVLALAGGALGLLVARWGLEALLAAYPDAVPRAGGIGLDGSVLAFTLAVALVTGIGFGLAPALHVRRRDVFDSLREGGRSGGGHRRLSQGLVVLEVALAAFLVVGAGLLLKSFWTLVEQDPGFDSGGLLTFQLELPGETYPEPREVTSFYRRLDARREALPGGVSAAAMSGMPPLRRINANTTEIEGLPEMPDGSGEPNVDYYQFVSPDYFETLGIDVVAGRSFSSADAAGAAPVVLVNRKMAERFWPDQQAVGRRVRRGWWGDEEPWHTVVGVVEDVKQGGMDQEPGTELYFLHHQVPDALAAVEGQAPRTMNLVVRAERDPMALAGDVRAAVAQLDRTLPLADLRTMDEVVSGSLERRRFLALMVGLFATLALLLAAVGTYGVLAYAVEQRRFELGVRMALGAEARRVLLSVLGRGMALAGAGLLLGLAGAIALRRVLASHLWGVEPTDPVTYAAVAAVLALVALTACYVPARRAMGVDPVEVLKAE
jgi:putative ABC transport system permease protein